MDRYKLLFSDNSWKLASEVDQYIKNGYEPFGSPFVTYKIRGGFQELEFFYQAVVLKNEIGGDKKDV